MLRRRAPRRWLSAALCLVVAAATAAVAVPAAGAQSAASGTVVIANGWSSADAAVASAVAASRNTAASPAVVLYSRADRLSDRTASYIEANPPAAVVLIGGATALSAEVASSVAGLTGAEPERITGASRYETAANAVSWTASTFVVANGHSPADTGVAAALAAVTDNAAVVLSAATSLTDATEKVIRERLPRNVILVGGASVLDESLEARIAELAPDATVSRRSGSSRTATAASAAPNGSTTLVVANGWSPADTSVAAALAAITADSAVLYSQERDLTSPTSRRIAALQPSRVLLVGGTAALSSRLHREIHCLAPGAGLSRISGSDRIDTAARAASRMFTSVRTDFECGSGAGAGAGGAGAGTGGTGGTGGTTNVTLPNAPTRLRALATNKALQLSWTAPSVGVVTKYSIQYRVQDTDSQQSGNQPGGWVTASTTTTGTSLTVNGPAVDSGAFKGNPSTTPSLTNGTAYELQVRGRNSFGDGPWSSPLAVGTPESTPGAPGIRSLEPNDRGLVLKWSFPTQTGGYDITSYDVRHRACTATDSDSTVLTCATNPTWGSWTSADVGDNTEHTITGLTNGTAYQVQVRAINSVGDGTWSKAMTGTPAAVPSAPGAPTVTPGDRQLTVTWTAPTGSIIDYDVRYRAEIGSCGDNCTLVGPWVNRSGETASDTAASATLTSLTNGTTYTVQVRAANSMGESPWSQGADGTPAGTPSAPTGLQVETVSATSLKASWTAANGNGAAVTDYDVQHRACTATPKSCTSSPTWSAWTARTGETASDTATSATVTGLTAGTKYQVRVRAANSIGGESGWSSSASGTPNAVPAAPSAPTVAVGNKQLSVSWTAPSNGGSTITDYDVRYRACTATPKTCATNPAWGGWSSHSHTGIGTTATVTGLTNGTKHQVQVRATNGTGTGAWSPSGAATPAGPPLAAPRNLTTERGNGLLSIAWTAPSDNGSPITQYVVAYCARSADENCSTPGDWTDSRTSSSTAYILDRLTNGTTYRWRVQAQNAQGSGPWSLVAGGTPATSPGLPRQSTDGIIGNDRSLKATWDAPESDGGAAVTDYDVQYRITDTDSVQTGDQPGPWTDHSHTGTSRTATITGLTNGVEYDVQARATNSVGTGSWANLGSVRAGGPPLAPAAPTVTSGDTKLTVGWAKPGNNGGGDITGYAVDYRIQDTDQTTAGNQPGAWRGDSPSGNVLTHDVTGSGGLTNGTAYEVRVAATNARGQGAWSPTAAGTPAGAPDAPSDVSAAGANASVTVTWSTPAANGSTVTGFRVRHCTNDTACAAANDVLGTANVSGASIRSFTITSLTNGTSYDVQVQTVSSSHDDSAWSVVADGAAGGPPSAPTGLSATAGNASIALKWTTPADTGGWVIGGYTVQYCDNSTGCDADSEWTNATTAHDTTNYTITSLTNGTTYRVRVNASNGPRGAGPWSSTVTAKPATTPKDLTQVTLRSGNASLTVGWSVAATNWTNGSTVTGFDVRYCDRDRFDSGGDPIDCGSSYSHWTTVTVSGSSSRSRTVTGLTNGSMHSVEVRVTSSDQGSSGWLAWTQTGDLPGSNTPGAPSQVAGLSLSVSGSALKASWTAATPNGDPVSQYDLQYCNETDDDCSQDQFWQPSDPVSVTGTSYTLPSYFDTGDVIKVRVRAANGFGNGPWSSVAQGTWP